jgi:hypothetical protein
MEQWKQINENYFISNLGNIKSNKCRNGRGFGEKYERLLKPVLKKTGYYEVYIGKWELVHRLVAKYFIPNSENKPCVDHIDFDKSNNKINNLRWVTYEENNKFRYDAGRANQYTLYGRKYKNI